MVKKLSPYRAKRDFSATSEPRGTIARSASNRFVVQKHDATRLHYDLRLELDGVFKSWAVTKTPSLDPAVKRLAIAVEDHPLDYGTFEGTIPEGHYGAGTVQLWDRGRWKPLGENPGRDLRNGRLSFILSGKRMKGGWALIRLPRRGKQQGWLLIKEDDDEAKRGKAGDALEREATSVKSGRTLDAIAKHARA
jgi:bifunctional non-homologous end joining protein LigD